MFSSTFSGTGNNVAPASGQNPAPRIYATVEEAEVAAEREAQLGAPRRKEAYEKIQRRQRAEVILGQFDLLMKYAVENQISIPQTRAYFRKVALGIETEAVIKNWFT